MDEDDFDMAMRSLDRMLSQYLPLKLADALMEVAREALYVDNTMRLEVAVQRLAALLPEVPA